MFKRIKAKKVIKEYIKMASYIERNLITAFMKEEDEEEAKNIMERIKQCSEGKTELKKLLASL